MQNQEKPVTRDFQVILDVKPSRENREWVLTKRLLNFKEGILVEIGDPYQEIVDVPRPASES